MLNSKYHDWIWNEDTKELESLGPNYEFGRQRKSYAIANAPHAIVYWSPNILRLVVVTNIITTDPIFRSHLTEACNAFVNYMEALMLHRANKGKEAQTFALELICDKVTDLETYYGD